MERIQNRKKIACIILILISAVGFIGEEPLLTREDQRLHNWLTGMSRFAIAFLGIFAVDCFRENKTTSNISPFDYDYHPLLAFLQTVIVPRLHQSSYLSLH